MDNNSFEKLRSVNVGAHIEKKNGLSYLPWAWAWDEFKRQCPDAKYSVMKNPEGFPYFDSPAGAMVFTSVSAGGETYEMWLPVLDGRNFAMKSVAYSVTSRRGDIQVDAYTMADINKAIMRCLVKNFAMFGLGLYIYEGEDIPKDMRDDVDAEQQKPVDIEALLLQIQSAVDMQELKSFYVEAVKSVRGNRQSLVMLERMKDRRKAELAETIKEQTE